MRFGSVASRLGPSALLWVWLAPCTPRAEDRAVADPAAAAAAATPVRTIPVDLVGPGACARCHPAVAKQWAASTHAHSSLDNPWYRGSLRNFKRDRPTELAFCGKCHDPVLIAQNNLDPEASGPGAEAGIGCALCHSLAANPAQVAAHGRTNGEFTLTAAPIPLGIVPAKTGTDGDAPSAQARPTDDRSAHGERLLPAELRADTACATCHEVRLTEAITAAHWQRGQSDWFDWYDGPWSGRGLDVILRPETEVRNCNGCHMRKLAVDERERGRDAEGKVRDHRFLGGHVALARLRTDPETEAALVENLRSAVALTLRSARPGFLDVILRNVGVGHAFPGGTQDAKQVWLELTAWNTMGEIISKRGHLEPDGRLPEDAWLIRGRPVNAEADPVPGRAAWTQRGVVVDTRLRPGIPRVARFALPPDTTRAQVRLRLRRFGPDDVALLCGADAQPGCRTPPITDLVVAEVPVAQGVAQGPAVPWKLLIAHAMGLTAGLSEHVAEATAILAEAARLAPPGAPELILARARHATTLGRTDEVVRLLADLDDPRARFIETQALSQAFRHGPARAAAERMLAAAPDNRMALELTARLRALTGDHEGALAAAETLLAFDPHHDHALHQRFLALRSLGRPEAAAAETTWLKHRRRDELDQELRATYRRRHPGDHAVDGLVGPDSGLNSQVVIAP